MTILFATAEAAAGHSSGIFQALGIDGKLLILQGIAFLILVWLMGKFVYPHLIKAIESRRDAIEEGLAQAKKADEELKKTEDKVGKIMADARAEADDIIARSKTEAVGIVESAEEKATRRAEQIVADAQDKLQNDVAAAREALRHETIELVATATEKVIGEKLDTKKDAQLIDQALAMQAFGKKG